MLMFLMPVSVLAASQSDFQNCAEVNLNDTPSDYNIFDLPDEVIGQSKADLSDLRIFHGAEEVPYAVISDYETTATSTDAQMMNLGTDASGNIVFELKIPDGRWTEQINLKSENENFIRSVKVEGSMDRKEWRLLTSDHTIFDLTSEAKSRHLEVNLPPTDLLFLRITILKGEKGEFSPAGAELIFIDQPNVPVKPLKERPYQTLAHNNQDGIETYTVDLLQNQLPVEELEFVTNDQNFNRIITLYESEDGKEWTHAAESEIYSYLFDQLSAKLDVVPCQTTRRYLKLEIHNGDNRPLNIKEINVRGNNPSIIVPADQNTEYILYWNSSQVKSPVYDIEKFKNNLDYENIPKASIGEIKKNETYVFQDNRPWTERNSWLLKLAIIGAAAVLLLIIVRSFLKISKEN
jgi:hypothetical protein